MHEMKDNLKKNEKEPETRPSNKIGGNSLQKVVVTDALGFIGFHLCRRLLDEGIEVAGIDNLGTNRRQKENRMDYFGRNALFTLIDGKIGEVSLEESLEEADACFYLHSLVAKLKKDLHKSISTMCRRIQAISGMIGKQAPRFIYASSTDVYGHVSGEVKESSELSPTTPKGIISVTEEAILLDGGLPLTILRLPEIYGPGQPSSGSIHQLLFGESIGHQPSDVLYIDDAIEAFLLAAAQPTNGIYNIASGKPGEWNYCMDYIHGKMRTGEREEETWYSIEKAEQDFGFKPKITIKEGIDKQKRQRRFE